MKIKNREKNIFYKLFGWQVIIIFVLSLSIFLFSFSSIKIHYLTTLQSNLINLAKTLNLKILPLLEAKQISELDLLVKNLDKDINIRITVVNDEGIVLADSQNNPQTMENHKNRPEIKKALQGNTAQSLRYSETVKKEMLYVAIPIWQDGKITGALRVSLFAEHINLLLNNLKVKFLRVTLVMILISLAIALIFSRNLSKPIKELSRVSKEIARGNFDIRVNIKNNDELRDLAESFNYMTQEIKKLFTDISQKKKELDSILCSIKEGLILIDREDRIILSNDSFKDIVKNKNIDGKFYWEILREPGFINLIKKVKTDRMNTISEVELGNKIFLASVVQLSSGEETVLTLSDITEIKMTETIKKDFVANVSHELKTPLTSVKGFVETIEEGITNEKSRHYLDIIKRNIDRLINIVQDLLVLSTLEEKGTRLELQQISLNEILNDVLRIFDQKINEKHLKLNLDIEQDLNINGDPFQIEQMFVNLIDNAIKYTEQGEITIIIKQTGSTLKIEIEDTGIGIAKEHLPRIFERFYVIDKSRSRKLGGTGLGLSIVKHIVLLHNGSINVESTVGKGTKFIINLPI